MKMCQRGVIKRWVLLYCAMLCTGLWVGLVHSAESDEDPFNLAVDDLTTATIPPPATTQEATTVQPTPKSEMAAFMELNDLIKERIENMLKTLLPDMLEIAYSSEVSATCTSAVLDLIRGLRDLEAWAFRMIDANGKVVSGVMEGTITDFGGYDECKNLFVSVKDVRGYGDPKTEAFRGKYCSIEARGNFKNFNLSDPIIAKLSPSHILLDEDMLEFWKRNDILAFRLGLCVPSSCSNEDVNAAVQFMAKSHVRGMSVNVPRCEVKEPLKVDNLQIGLLITLGLLLVIVIAGTILDLSCYDVKQVEESDKKKMASMICTLRKILVSFAITVNTKKLFDTSKQPSTFKEFDAMRFFSVLWVIIGHTYFYYNLTFYRHYRGIQNFLKVDDEAWFAPISNFTLSVDTFFFISGVLIVTANWRKLEKTKGKLDIVYFIVHRLWRIYPAYLVAIALTILLPLIGTGPQWYEAVETEADNCRENWWLNLLFINNFLRLDKMCLLHTWFLGANMQFHLAAFFILLILYRWSIVGFIVSIALTIICGIATYLHFHLFNVRGPTIVSHFVMGDSEVKVINLYMKPYTHMGAYLVGMLFGYFHLKARKSGLSLTWAAIGWCVSTTIAIAVTWGPLKVWRDEPQSSESLGIYAAAHRTAWALSIAWITYACSKKRAGFISKFLSLKCFMPLGNLSYSAYLIHAFHIYYHAGRMRERTLYSHYDIMLLFISRTLLVFVLSYLMYVIVELPFAQVERYIFRWDQKNSSKKSKTTETETKSHTWNSGKDGPPNDLTIIVTLPPNPHTGN